MGKKPFNIIHYYNLLPLPLLLFLSLGATHALPLSTSSRWIVDDDGGQRVKLACVNWVSHLELVVAEGLSKQPVDNISNKIIEMGFNCVRFTWPIYLATNHSLASLTVRQSFLNHNLNDHINGFLANNPTFLDLSLIQAFQAVVTSLTDNNVMVILDNHITTPGWCCSRTDGNGFFGDTYFNPDLWIQGLTKMATLFKDNPNVVGMSLRNELRGPKENANDWYRYMQKGAEAVHGANPNVLVILSGLNFDKDLSFLRTKPVTLSFTNKLVFEVHWYAFSDGSAWKDGDPNKVCGRVVANYMRMAGFLLDQGYPLFVSEWGVDLRGTNVNDNRYLDCFLSWVAEHDLDWALWTLVGSYYLREGVVEMIEYYGVLDSDWMTIRNSSFLDRISAIQVPIQGPQKSHRKTTQKMIFHPSTGLCITRKSLTELQLGKCFESNLWTYTPQKTLNINGHYFCIKAQGSEQPVTLDIFCQGMGTSWEPMSDSKLHLSTRVGGNKTVCLDVDARNNVIASSCKCLSGDKSCDPRSQWFKIVDVSGLRDGEFIEGEHSTAQLAAI